MLLEEQIKLYKNIAAQIEKLEEEKRSLGLAILQQMEGKRIVLPDYIVHRYERFSIKLSIEEARDFGATKQQEVVDRDKIKALYHTGQQIKGVSKAPYIIIVSNNKSTPYTKDCATTAR